MKVNLGRYPQGNAQRRLRIQIDPWDTYSLDHTLALIIVPALRQLRAEKHGVPGNMPAMQYGTEDWRGQQCFDFYSEDDPHLDVAQQQWDEILDHMIWAFEQIADDSWEQQYHTGVTDYQKKPCAWDAAGNPTLYGLEHGPSHTHEFDEQGYRRHQERIQEGLDLFSKYYFNLWD